MRILFVTSPMLGHLFPVVPLIWAAREAGHEVLLLSSGDAAAAGVKAGLPAVDLAAYRPEVRRRFEPPWPGSPAGSGSRPAPSGTGAGIPEAKGQQGTLPDHAMMLFAWLSDEMAEGAMELSRRWRPDCVVHSSFDGVGPLVAEALDVPLVQHTFAMGVQPREMLVGIRRKMRAPEAKAAGGDTPREPAAIIDPGPASVRLADTASVWRCRFVPYSGGYALPEWLFEDPDRPRICLTLGTVVPRIAGTDAFRPVLDAAADLSVEVALAHGAVDIGPLAPLPANVRPTGWAPLSALFPTCTAVVHHGGAGTAAAALAQGLPQLLLPLMADQFDIAQAVQRSGAGRVLQPAEATAEAVAGALRGLLGDDEVRERALAAARENAELPGPGDLLGKLAALAG